MFFLHYLLWLKLVLAAGMPPALGCFVGTWEKWRLPWMLFWAGLDTGATHILLQALIIPGITLGYGYSTHTLTEHTAIHHKFKLSHWAVLTAAIQPAPGSPTPDLSSSITGLGILRHTPKHTSTHMATVYKWMWRVFETKPELTGERMTEDTENTRRTIKSL